MDEARPRRVVWPWFVAALVLVAVVIVVATGFLAGLDHTGAENARNQVLHIDAPRIVRMVRTAAGDALGGPTEEEAATVCVRFEIYAYDYTFKEIDCH